MMSRDGVIFAMPVLRGGDSPPPKRASRTPCKMHYIVLLNLYVTDQSVG